MSFLFPQIPTILCFLDSSYRSGFRSEIISHWPKEFSLVFLIVLLLAVNSVKFDSLCLSGKKKRSPSTFTGYRYLGDKFLSTF